MHAAPARQVGNGGEAADHRHVALVLVGEGFALALKVFAEVFALRFGDLSQLRVTVRVVRIAFDQGTVANGIDVFQALHA